MNRLSALITISALAVLSCAAQDVPSKRNGYPGQKQIPDFYQHRGEMLKANPRGLAFKISLASDRSVFRFGEKIEINLIFTSSKPGKYSVELDDMNGVSSSDNFVFRREDGSAVQLPTTEGIVCCYTRRRYVRTKPLTTKRALDPAAYSRYSGRVIGGFIGSYLHIPTPEQIRKQKLPLPPGDYDFFMQTSRAMRGWPIFNQTVDELYEDTGKHTVVSENTLHITVLPSGAAGWGDEVEDRDATQAGFSTRSFSNAHFYVDWEPLREGEWWKLTFADFGTPEEAKRFLDWKVARSAKILKQETETNPKGNTVSYRAEVEVVDEKNQPTIELMWVIRGHFRVISVRSLNDARDLEKRYRSEFGER